MERSESKALLAEYRRAVNALAQVVASWDPGKANRPMPSAPGTTYLAAAKAGLRTSYEYITWIQKSAALPRLAPPDNFDNLDSLDLRTFVSVINFLGPYAAECLSGLTDEQLQYRPVRDYTLAQMLEHAIVSVWLQVGRIEKV